MLHSHLCFLLPGSELNRYRNGNNITDRSLPGKLFSRLDWIMELNINIITLI